MKTREPSTIPAAAPAYKVAHFAKPAQISHPKARRLRRRGPDHIDEASLEKRVPLPPPGRISHRLDGLYHDGYDCTIGTYLGGPHMSDLIAVNLLNVLEREEAC